MIQCGLVIGEGSQLQGTGSSLIGVGDEKASRGKGGSSLVDAASSPELVGILDTLLARQCRMNEGVARKSRSFRKVHDLIGSLSVAATGEAVGLGAGGVVGWAMGVRRFSHQTARTLRGVIWAVSSAVQAGGSHRCSVVQTASATASAASPAASRPTVVQLRNFVVVATLSLDLGCAET
jgi:hypothetical protein